LKEELRNYINKIQKMPDELLDEFLLYWHLKKANKKEAVTQINTVESYLYFTTKGVQKAYYITEGEEYIIAFTRPYAFTCIPESFLTQLPSNYCFECITESEFYRISYNDFFKFVENQREFETLLRKSLTNILGGVVTRYHRLLAFSMEDRFRNFMKNSPELINLVPQKDIANYLKMDPTNFSKLINSVKL
jgi:CRP-like cAMP-binding protein